MEDGSRITPNKFSKKFYEKESWEPTDYSDAERESRRKVEDISRFGTLDYKWTAKYEDFSDVVVCPDIGLVIPEDAKRKPYNIATFNVCPKNKNLEDLPFIEFYSLDGFIGSICDEFKEYSKNIEKRIEILYKLSDDKNVDPEKRRKYKNELVLFTRQLYNLSQEVNKVAMGFLSEKFQVIVRPK